MVFGALYNGSLDMHGKSCELFVQGTLAGMYLNCLAFEGEVSWLSAVLAWLHTKTVEKASVSSELHEHLTHVIPCHSKPEAATASCILACERSFPLVSSRAKALTILSSFSCTTWRRFQFRRSMDLTGICKQEENFLSLLFPCSQLVPILKHGQRP